MARPFVAGLLLLSFPLRPMKAHYFPRGGGVREPPDTLKKYPNHSGTIPVSEYNLPIYRSLPLDHFDTPRHVRDLIRDSEQTSFIKSHNS